MRVGDANAGLCAAFQKRPEEKARGENSGFSKAGCRVVVAENTGIRKGGSAEPDGFAPVHGRCLAESMGRISVKVTVYEPEDS